MTRVGRSLAAALVIGGGLTLVTLAGRGISQHKIDRPPGKLYFLPNDRVSLFAHDRVLVGDSMCVNWPGDDFDVIAFSMMPAGTILDYAERFLPEMSHREIVFWVGTAHLQHGHPLEALFRDLEALVDLAGDRPYVVIGPLCPITASEETRALYAEANAVLTHEYPEAFIDPAAVLQIPGPGEEFLADYVHLNPEGYAVLEPVVNDRLRAAAGS